MNKLKKKHMTKFDYNIRIFSVISGILFVAALAFVSPLLDNVNASLEKTSDAIKIQTLQNNYAKYDDNIALVNND